MDMSIKTDSDLGTASSEWALLLSDVIFVQGADQ